MELTMFNSQQQLSGWAELNALFLLSISFATPSIVIQIRDSQLLLPASGSRGGVILPFATSCCDNSALASHLDPEGAGAIPSPGSSDGAGVKLSSNIVTHTATAASSSASVLSTSGGADGAGSLPLVDGRSGKMATPLSGGSEGSGSVPFMDGLVSAHLPSVRTPMGTEVLPFYGEADGAGELPSLDRSSEVTVGASNIKKLHSANTVLEPVALPSIRKMRGSFQSTTGAIIHNNHTVADELIYIIHPSLGLVAETRADSYGVFCVEVPETAGLEIVLPEEGIAGIPMITDAPLLIVIT
jgi:hypothetical protein